MGHFTRRAARRKPQYLSTESPAMHSLSFADWSPVTPLRSLMAWLAGPVARPAVPARVGLALPASVPPPCPAERRSRPLRVLRVLDGPQPRAAAGRMVISGRFADVCAELDRLAAQETR